MSEYAIAEDTARNPPERAGAPDRSGDGVGGGCARDQSRDTFGSPTSSTKLRRLTRLRAALPTSAIAIKLRPPILEQHPARVRSLGVGEIDVGEEHGVFDRAVPGHARRLPARRRTTRRQTSARLRRRRDCRARRSSRSGTRRCTSRLRRSRPATRRPRRPAARRRDPRRASASARMYSGKWRS